MGTDVSNKQTIQASKQASKQVNKQTKNKQTYKSCLWCVYQAARQSKMASVSLQRCVELQPGDRDGNIVLQRCGSLMNDLLSCPEFQMTSEQFDTWKQKLQALRFAPVLYSRLWCMYQARCPRSESEIAVPSCAVWSGVHLARKGDVNGLRNEPQEVPMTTSRRPKTAPRWPQDVLKTPPRRPKMPHDVPRCRRISPRRPSKFPFKTNAEEILCYSVFLIQFYDFPVFES